MSLYPVPQRAFKRVHIDLLMNLSETCQGNKHVLVCVDALTRYVELIPLANKTAEACAMAFHDEFIMRYSPPETLVSDNGLEFTNAIMKNLAEKYQINHVHTTPYRPQGNGLAERTIRKLLNVLRMSISEEEPNWDKSLRMAQNLLNTTVNSSIKRTPFQALYGQCPRLAFESPVYPSQKEDDPIRIRINNAKLMRENLRVK